MCTARVPILIPQFGLTLKDCQSFHSQQALKRLYEHVALDKVYE